MVSQFFLCWFSFHLLIWYLWWAIFENCINAKWYFELSISRLISLNWPLPKKIIFKPNKMKVRLLIVFLDFSSSVELLRPMRILKWKQHENSFTQWNICYIRSVNYISWFCFLFNLWLKVFFWSFNWNLIFIKVFVVLALCVCAAQASFFNLGGGSSGGSSAPKIVKIINVSGGSSGGGGGGWASSAPAAPVKIIKVNFSFDANRFSKWLFVLLRNQCLRGKRISTFHSKESEILKQSIRFFFLKKPLHIL